MTRLLLEVEVPEELADRWPSLPAEEKNRYAVAAANAVRSVIEQERGTERRGLMRFAGAGKGMPGALAVEADPQTHVNSLRDEWDERQP
jgi:hypothetical protein